MSAQHDHIPTLREELDRKVFETLNWLVTGHTKGIMTADQLSMGADTLFMAVSGLVDKEFIQIITSTQEMLEGASATPVRRVFRSTGQDTTVIFTWKPGSFCAAMQRYEGSTLTADTGKEFPEREQARDYVLNIHVALTKKGFIEL